MNPNDKDYIPDSILKLCESSQKTGMLLGLHNDGSIYKLLPSKRGNSTYCFNQLAKMNVLNKQAKTMLHADKENKNTNTFLCTLTTHYTPNSIKSSMEAVKRVVERKPLFIKQLSRYAGKFEYMLCLESHKHGGCHIHIVIMFEDTTFKCFMDKNHIYRNDKMRELVKRAWGIGNVDVEGIMSDSGVFNYIYKELGKAGNLSGALYRYKHHNELVKNDTNKIWLFGLAENYKKETKKSLRFFSYSKGLHANKTDIKKEKLRILNERKARLDNIGNKSDKLETVMSESDKFINTYEAMNSNKIVKYCYINKNLASTLPSFWMSGKVKDVKEYEIYKKVIDDYGITVFEGFSIELPDTFTNETDKLKKLVSKILDIPDVKTNKNMMMYKSLKQEFIKSISKLHETDKKLAESMLFDVCEHQNKILNA